MASGNVTSSCTRGSRLVVCVDCDFTSLVDNRPSVPSSRTFLFIFQNMLVHSFADSVQSLSLRFGSAQLIGLITQIMSSNVKFVLCNGG